MESYYDFLTRVLVNFAVPGFFMCSGFLFFLNYKGFGSYGNKIKSRIRGLFIPYLFWISLSIFVTWFIQNVLGLASLFGAGNMKLIHDFDTYDFLLSYWNLRDGTFPFLSTLWFLRDLMVCVLLAPILYQVLRLDKVSVLVILVFIALTILGFSLLNIAMSSILYFIMGGVLIYSRNQTFCMDKKQTVISLWNGIHFYHLLFFCLYGRYVKPRIYV